MSKLAQLIVFRVDDLRYALPIEAVEHVIRAVEVTQLPNAPAMVLGVIDVGGRVLPVLNLRRRSGLPDREIRITDQFLIAATRQRTVVLPIDEAQGVMECPTEAIEATSVVPGLEQIQGVVQLENGLALIYDLEQFFSIDEALALDRALREGAIDGS